MKTCSCCGGDYADHFTHCEKGHLLINSPDDKVVPPPPIPNPYAVSADRLQEVVSTTKAKAPLKAGWICLILGYVLSALCFFPVLRVLSVVAYGFGLAALILGIVCMVRKSKIQGFIMIILIILNPLIYHIILLLLGAFWIFQVMREPEKKVDFSPPKRGGEHLERSMRQKPGP